MHRPASVLLAALSLALAACTTQPGGFGGLLDPAEAERRAAVELAVKAAFPDILVDIAAGGGASLELAFDAAGVPAADRPARRLQLRGDLDLYERSPAALAAALALAGG